MRPVGFRVEDEEAAGALADPLDEARVIRAAQQGFDAVQRIGAAAAGAIVRLGPLVNHRERKAEVGGDLFGAGLLKHLAKHFVSLHGASMKSTARVGKTERVKPLSLICNMAE